MNRNRKPTYEEYVMTDARFKLGMGQMLVQGGEVEANLERAVEVIREAAGQSCDIVVLPECLDVGWTHPSARELAEHLEVIQIEARKNKASGTAIASMLRDRNYEGP